MASVGRPLEVAARNRTRFKPLAAPGSSMSVAGLCGICETARASRQCQQCGTLVCADHYREGQGVCARCATGGAGDRLQF